MKNKESFSRWWNFRADKGVVVLMVVVHLIVLAAFSSHYFSWSGVFWMLFLFWVSGGLGITLCYHRLLSHPSFKTYRWLRTTLTACACLALQGSPIVWAGTHRFHHKHSDKDNDPHSPVHGVMWAHFIWVLTKNPEGFSSRDYARDLEREKVMLWFHRFWWLPQIIVSILLIVAGFLSGGVQLAISWFVWGIALRTVLVFHATWFVNSASHIWGYRNFETDDNSRNCWWVALLTFGEGWHNNHHANPNCASHGMKWFEIDFTYLTILLLEKIGLAWSVKKYD